MTRLEINRRTALLTSAAIAANVLDPMRAFAQETPRKGGVFNVHYGAEQRQLNPSIQASTGVYIIGGKIQETSGRSRRQRPAGRRARRKLGRLARRQDHHLQAAQGRHLARRQAVHLGGRRIHRHADVEEDSQLRVDAAAVPYRGRYARCADRGVSLRAADAAQPVAARVAGPWLHLGEAPV